MKNNSKLKILVLYTIFIVSSVVTISLCKQDSCKTVNCAYGGHCVNGLCTCEPGYQGPNCETMSRDKFTGIWETTQVGPLASTNKYAISIQKDSLATWVAIKNLTNGLSPYNVYATIMNDSLTIEKQTIGQDTIYGSGGIYLTSGATNRYNYISMVYHIAYPQGKVEEYVLHCTR